MGEIPYPFLNINRLLLLQVGHKPECIGISNPDRLVLITIITLHFQFHPVNVSNRAYVLEARAVSRGALRHVVP